MNKNKVMPVSLDGEAFASLKRDFDKLVNRTIGNMEMRRAEEATVTVKLSIKLEKTKVDTPDGLIDVTKPTFKHDINSVMQVKDKMTGQQVGEYAIVWDEEEERYVMKKIDNGQIGLFDKEEGYVDVEFEDVTANNANALPSGIAALPEAEHLPEEPDVIPAEDGTPFQWLNHFVGEQLHVTEAMGNYTVRTNDNKVVLSTATTPASIFYCKKTTLVGHAGHTLYISRQDDDYAASIKVTCLDCEKVLFTVSVASTLTTTTNYENDEDDCAGGEEDLAECLEDEDDDEFEDDYDYEDPED